MYDSIIIGGGPAGSSAAMYSSRKGLNTILLDKTSFPRDKVCGDAISGKAIQLLDELDLLDGVDLLKGDQINRIIFGGPNQKTFELKLKFNENENHIKEGYVIKREIFDNYLFQKAKEECDYKENFNVTDLIYKNDTVIGIKGFDTDRKEETIYGKVICGADGSNSIVAQKTGNYKMDNKHTALAIRCYYKNVSGLSDQIELHYIDELRPGYFWLFPAGDGIANIGLGLLKSDIKKSKKNLVKYLDIVTESKAFKKRFKNAIKLENPVGWNLPMGSKVRNSYGNGYLLLGDAAGLIDPFTGEGIGNAMISAKIASETIIKAKIENNFSADSLKEYHTNVWKTIGGELDTSTRLQKVARYRFLLNFVINRANRNDGVRDIISGMLANQIPRSEIANPLFYLKILFN